VLASFLYKLTTRFAQFVVLRLRADIDKDVEILVLRHQLAVLRRQVGKVRTRSADQAVLALLSRLLSRAHWPAFFVTPATLLRWHRDAVRRKWT
jgi:putative transposase